MRSLKAIIIGSLFILIAGMLIQLAYIFLAVGYINLAKEYRMLNEISVYFRYFLGIPVFFLLMFAGGYITADIARKRILLHSTTVALIVISLMTVSALEQAEMTLSGFVVFTLAFIATVAGGLYWGKQHN